MEDGPLNSNGYRNGLQTPLGPVLGSPDLWKRSCVYVYVLYIGAYIALIQSMFLLLRYSLRSTMCELDRCRPRSFIGLHLLLSEALEGHNGTSRQHSNTLSKLRRNKLEEVKQANSARALNPAPNKPGVETLKP